MAQDTARVKSDSLLARLRALEASVEALQKQMAETAPAGVAVRRRVQVELPTARIAPLYQSLQSACAADTADACVVLRASLDTGAWTHAELSLRAAPAGVGKLLDRLHGTGGVWQEAMEGEDLAAPIVDGERRIAMLRDYRDSLLALRARQGTTIDALIRINSELAQAQSQLETAAGEAAHLRQRVDTQVLAVAIAPPAGERRATPVADALHRFGGNFAHAAAGVVTFVAWALPWLLLLFFWASKGRVRDDGTS